MKKNIVLNFISISTGFIFGSIMVLKKMSNVVIKEKENGNKNLAVAQMLNRWLEIKQEGKNASDYCKKKGIQSIAIYGMNYVGNTLYNEIVSGNIDVKYVIDRNADNIYCECEVLHPDDYLQAVDAIIVTPIYFFEDIKKDLVRKVNCPIISLSDVLRDI